MVCHHQKGEIVSFEVDLAQIKGDLGDLRSEERRVGKECRL